MARRATLGHWLNRIEKIIESDIRYILRGGFWLSVGKAFAALSSLALAIAFANLLSKELFGNYKYILSLAALIGSFSLSGVGTALTRAVARGHDGEFGRSINSAFWWSIPASILALAASAYYGYNGNFTLATSLCVIAFLNPLTNATSLFQPFLLGKKEFRTRTILSSLQASVPAFLVIASLYVSHSVILLASVMLISTLLINAFSTYYSRRHFVSNAALDSEAPRLTLHASILAFLGTVAGKADAILIFQNLGATPLAIYAFATAMPDALRGSTKIFSALATPKFAQKNTDQLKRSLEKKRIYTAGVLIGATISYITLAPWIFSTFFPLYIDSLLYSQVYALTVLFSAPLASAYFDAQLAIKERYASGIFSAITQVGFALIGLTYWGLWGVIFARVLARASLVAFLAILIRWHARA